MDQRSEAVLVHVDPALAGKVRAAADKLATAGTHLLVVSGLRTGAEQDVLYTKGRNGVPGPIVTHVRGGHSMHNYGLAVDVAPYLSGTTGAVNWDAKTPKFQAMVAALVAEGLVWGGAWKTFPDDDHFQMPDTPANPSDAMVADFGDGGPAALSAIWQKTAAGDYAV